MASSANDLGYPEWTTKAEKRGLDPLGMQTTSVALYQQLMPGISNVTLRMRYYGFYAWLAQRYAMDVGDTSVERWCIYLRRAEALYALIAVHAGGERGVAGVDWATGALAQPGAEIVFHEATDRKEGQKQYLKQKFGAFGAAYGSQLDVIKVLEFVPGHDVPVPTQGAGSKLAEAFALAIGACAGVFLAATKAGAVQRNTLDSLTAMAPSRISMVGPERELYEALLFGSPHAQEARATSRSQTLRLVLRVAKGQGSAVRIDQVRWALYASQCMSVSPFGALDAAEDRQRFAWAVYQANDLLHVGYETVLKLALDILGAAPSGIPFEALVKRTVGRLISALSSHQAKTWEELVSSLEVAVDPSLERDTKSEFALHKAAMRSSRPEVLTSDDSARSAMLLLATLYKRFISLLDRIAQELPVLAQGDFLRSLVTELRFFETHSTEPLESLLTRLVQQRVLDRHLWVAIQKFRGQGDYTFLLEGDDGRVRLRQKDGPVLTTPRLASAIAFLEDIHLLGESGPTPAGLRAIETA